MKHRVEHKKRRKLHIISAEDGMMGIYPFITNKFTILLYSLISQVLPILFLNLKIPTSPCILGVSKSTILGMNYVTALGFSDTHPEMVEKDAAVLVL